ncbi:DDE-type integrase/transposase/recombinase [Micromonospora sp. KLBMP9576]|uniref:DDE-type integrase/transposase/recombinase n=1 Tax=Micromonospora sp. KLBMP9576 TaxID=3424769 RepID=UPI003D8A3A91
MGEHHDAGLVVAVLNMAAVTRGGDVAGVIFRSDRGSEYTSADFARACARWKVRQSMGRVGSARASTTPWPRPPSPPSRSSTFTVTSSARAPRPG